MGEARIIQNQRIPTFKGRDAKYVDYQEARAAQQQAMADLVEASKLPATFVNCFTLQDGGPNAVRFVFSDQFNQGLRPVPRAAIMMDLALFRDMIERCGKVIAQMDEAAAKAAEPKAKVRNWINEDTDSDGPDDGTPKARDPESAR